MSCCQGMVLLLVLATISSGKVIDQPTVNKYTSPLDGPAENDDDTEPTFWAHGNEFVAEPSSCNAPCAAPVFQVLSVYFRTGTFRENMQQACKAYEDATTCMERHRHCGTDSMVESLISGIRYMCREQKDAFNALADCIDANSWRVRQDCDQQCHPNSLATGIAVKDTVMNQLEHPLVSKNVNMRRIIEPHMSRFFFSQGCKIAQCLMACTRTKYNMICEGTAGSLLLEMLTLPLSVNERNSVPFVSTTHLTSFLGGLLPHQCAFLTSHDGNRNSFRIDPELDKEIKRMYSDRNKTISVSLMSSLSQPVEIENPFMKISNEFHRASPFDNPESDIEILRSGIVPQKEEQVAESSGIMADPLQQTADDEEEGSSMTVDGSAIAENDVALVALEGSGELLSEQQVEAGKTYKIQIPEQSTSGGELICYIREQLS